MAWGRCLTNQTRHYIFALKIVRQVRRQRNPCKSEERAMVEKSRSEQRLLETLCSEYDVDPSLVDDLIQIEIENERRLRRRGLPDRLKNAIANHLTEREDDIP